MIAGCFAEYLRVAQNLKEVTIQHYISALAVTNNLLQESGMRFKQLYEIETPDDLIEIKRFLKADEAFKQKNKVGRHMYSAAFGHYCSFVEDEAFFNSFRISKLDAPIPAAAGDSITANKLIMNQAIRAEEYTCILGKSHSSFTDGKTKHAHMDGYHIIPLSCQKYFTVSLDVYSNIVSLCPFCNEKIQYGQLSERREMFGQLYDLRRKRLKNAGIDVTLENVLEFNQCLGECK